MDGVGVNSEGLVTGDPRIGFGVLVYEVIV